MPTEREKMVAGELYDPLDPELVAARARCRVLLRRLSAVADDAERAVVLAELFGAAGSGLWVEPPFFCDYGSNITAGERVYFNFNCVVLDVAPVRIGSRTMFGPGVQLLTATHPLDPVERSAGREAAKPITIGDDVWVGGGAIVLPGVTVGAAAVIGAGSVVTRDVPPRTVVAGNPARVIRQIP
ncbi:MAG: sugar O-acetyltransferase [Gemmataceae bacterium]